jgi:hypothetical protein
MSHYVLPTPRAALGLAAAAVTAIIIGVAVVAPARLDKAAGRSLEVSASVAPEQVEVVVIPAIEIVGTRDSNVVSAQGPDMVRTKSKQQI